jgi:hypothetical protein
MTTSPPLLDVTSSPEQLEIAAGWYERMKIASAKLAVAAGVNPAEAQRVSGLRRVEIQREFGPVARQTAELDKALVVTGEHVPPRLTDPAQLLSGNADSCGADYLQICNYARYKGAFCLYQKTVSDFNKEFNTLSKEFFLHKEQFECLVQEYDTLADRLREIISAAFGCADPSNSMTQGRAANFSWAKRERTLRMLQPIVERRDSLRTELAQASRRIKKIMDDHQRHHARRAFFRSKLNAQYRNYSMLFVPRATLYGMHKCNFDMPRGSSSEIATQMLQIAKKW